MKRFIVLIVGVIFLAVGIFMFVKNDSLKKNCTIEAEATVVDMKQEYTADTDTTGYMYYPIIEYTAGENTVRTTIEQGSSTPAYSIDQKITIMYNPKNTKEFYVKGEVTTNIMSIVFIALGAVISVFGAITAFKKQ